MRYIIGAAEHGSFRRAAGVLEVQQSTISRRVRELEDRLGAPIFERGATGVRLTKAGVQFLDGAQGAMTHLAYAVDRVGAFAQAERNIVRIGILAPLTSGFLDDLLRLAVDQRSPPQLSLTEGSAAEHLSGLRTGRLDLAFLTEAPAGSRCADRPLWRERLVAVLPAQHALAAKTQLGWPDLVDEHFLIPSGGSAGDIEGLLINRFSRLGRTPSITRQAVGRETLLRLIALGQGVMITVESAAGAALTGVISRPIAREAAPFHAVWSAQNSKPAVKRLIALAVQHAP